MTIYAVDDATNMRIARIIDLVHGELRRAYGKFPKPQNSLHEGYAVLLEEVDELWDEIKKDDGSRARTEAVQVAAMAVRLLADTGTDDDITLLEEQAQRRRMFP
jgi:NTP pyrophosphatase (non-canonical NTP hydrolase)